MTRAKRKKRNCFIVRPCFFRSAKIAKKIDILKLFARQKKYACKNKNTSIFAACLMPFTDIRNIFQ